MVPIRSRWHSGGIAGLPPSVPVRQAVLAFALYGLRLQAAGISPGPIEATITVTDNDGHLLGQLDLDARDAQWMMDAISAMLRDDYGPWRKEDADGLLAEYGPAGKPCRARLQAITMPHDRMRATRGDTPGSTSTFSPAASPCRCKRQDTGAAGASPFPAGAGVYVGRLRASQRFARPPLCGAYQSGFDQLKASEEGGNVVT